MNPKLLILDDSRSILFKLTQYIEQIGSRYEVFTATSFTQAKEIIATEEIDASILDLELPDSRDAEHIDYFLNLKIPVIVLTATFNENLQKIVSKKPVIDYIIKDTLEDIQSAITIADNLLLYKNKRALIVDDAKLFRYQLSSHLQRLGFITTEASSSENALEIIKSSAPFDLVTIDYEMPGDNGIKFIQKAKKLKNKYATLYFGVYSTDSSKVSIQFLKSGANDTFIKPLEKETFNLKIANAFSLIKQKEELDKSKHIFNEYINALNHASFLSRGDLQGNITFVSDQFCKLTGYKKSELIGKPHHIFRHPQTPKAVFRELWNTIQQGEIWSGLLQNKKKCGEIFYSNSTIVPLKDQAGIIYEYLSFRDDITELVKSKEELQAQFYTDSLTHLGNRNKLIKDLKNLNDNSFIALVHINDFNQLNNFYGHKVGDQIIVQISNFLFEYFYQHQFKIYRFDGVEFALLLENTNEPEKAFDLVEKAIKTLESKPLEIQNHTIHLHFTAGACNHADCLTRADLALRIARKEKKKILLFNESLQQTQEFQNNVIWSSKIKKAIKNDDILFYIQPIYNNSTKSIARFEVLMRLQEDETVHTPDKFLQISKQSGTYFSLTKKMINYAFDNFSNSQYPFSINLTVDDILENDVRDLLIARLKSIQGKNIYAIVELVESAGIESYQQVKEFQKEINSLGAKFAIDDFGTGYSNFEYLTELKPDIIKIDGSLIKDIDTDMKKQQIVKSIKDFALINNCEVVAEYVHNEIVAQKIIDFNIEYSQGFHFGKPLPFKDYGIIDDD